MNYYTDVSYDDVTGKLTLKDKLLNTSSIRGTGDGSTTFVGDIKIGDKADTVTLGTDTSKIALDHTAGTVGLTGDTTITGDLAVTGATTLTGALAVTGATTLTGALTANGGITTTDIASTSLTTNAAGKTVAIGGTGYTTTVTGNEVVTGTLSAGATTVDSLKLSGSTPVISSVQTTVRATGTADDVSLVTEKAVRTALTDTTDALLAANNTWTGVNTFNHSEDAAGAGVTGFSVTATDTDALAGGSSATTASLSVNSKTGVTVTGDETVTGNLAVTGATTLTGALTANGGITTTDIASTALTTSASGKTVAIGGTGYTTTVTGNEVVTGDLTVTGLTTFGATGFDLGGKTVTAIDDDGTNVSSSVAQATRQATLATAETVYAGAKTADYNGSTAGLNIAANETLGGAIGSLDTAIGNRDYADTSVYATTPSYLTAGESVAESLVALDKELTDTNTILGPAEVTAQTTGQFAGKKVGVDINVVDAVSELGVNMVSLGANNIFTGVNTFKNAAGIAIQDASGGNQVTLKAEADPSSTFSMLTVDRVINAPALRLGSNMVTSIDINGSGVTAANADKEVIATTKTVYSGAENALFTGPSSPSAALGSAATINAAITNVAGATDTNTTNIATLQSGKMDKADIVTAWSSTTSDTKVASEKLVKDTLDTKADLTGNNTFAGNNSFTGTQTMTNTVADASTATALSVAATNTAGSHSLVVSTDGVKVDGSDVLTQASIVTSAAGWSATTSDTKVASEKLVKDSLDAKVDNAGNFTAASNSDLIEGKTVIAAIQDTAAQVDINTAAIGTTSDGTYVLAANSVGQNLNALDAQVLANTTAIGTTSDGTYVAAANSVGQNLNALDAQVLANTTAIGTTSDGTYVAAANSVGQNLNALDTQVALNTAAIASVSGMIGTDPTAIATGSALNQLPGAYTQISGNGASGSITLADATSKLSEAFTNGQIDTNFKSVTTSSATVTNTETTAGNVATAFTAIAQNTADGKSTTLKVTSDNVELTQSGNTIHLGVENVGGGIGTALVVDANAGFSGIVKADGFDVGSTFSVNSSGAIEKAASITSDGKLTVNAGGADITGATSITGDTTITGDASVSGTATLGALTFNGTDTADAIATAGLDRGASGSATTLASTASVAATITTQAQDATYTNLVTSGSNITGGTIQLALKGLDEVIGNRSISSANSDVDSALGTSVSAAIAKIGDKLGDVDFSSANNTAATDLTTAISDVDAAVGDISALTTSKIISANTDLTTAVKSLEDNVATAMGGTFTNGAWSYTVDNTAGYAAYTAQTNVADAIDQVASNIGTAAEITTTGINGVANNQTVNKNIDELNKTLGNIKALDGTDGTGPKGNLAAANSTVADHLNAIDARMGDIAGLNTKRGASAKGNLDTTATAKVEDHFVALDDAIGDRTAFSNTVGVDYSTTGLNNNNVVGAISQVASNVGSTPVTGANGNVAAGNTVNQNLDALDAAIGDIGQFSQSEYMSRNATIADGMMNLDHNLHRVEKEMRGGFASMAALSALVPNARGAGDTQLSVGTGAYRDHQGIAVGAFHYFNDNVLANMGFSYGGDKSAIFRAGVTFGW